MALRGVDGKSLITPEEQAAHDRKQAAARWAVAGWEDRAAELDDQQRLRGWA